MRIMRLLILLATFSFMAGCVCKQEINDLDRLTQKIEAAVDLEGRGKDIKTMRVHAKTNITVMDFKSDIVVSYWFPNRLREDIKISGMEVTTIYDGKKAVEITKGLGSRELSSQEINFKKYDLLSSHPGIKLKDTYDKLELDPEKKDVNGRPCYRIVGYVNPELGIDPVEMFFDAETFLMIRQNSTVPTAMGTVPVSIDIHDYKYIDGFMVSTRAVSTFLSNIMTLQLEKVEFNVEFNKEDFEVPAKN